MTRSHNWPTVAFGDVVRLNTDRIADPAAAGIERYVGIEHITPGDLRVRSWGLVAEGTTFTNHFRTGQVLFPKRRAYQRKVALADFEGVCSGDIYVFESKDPAVLLSELLPFICQTDGFFDHAIGTSAGSLSPRTNWSHLTAYEFPLPPPAEQRRLVEILESILSIKEAIENTLYTSNVLIASFVNEMIETSLTNLAVKRTRIAELGLNGEPVMKTGPFGSNLKTSYFRESGIPIITIGSLQPTGLDESQFFYLDPIYEGRFEDYKTLIGDIVFSRVADVGRCHLITQRDEGLIISSNLIRIRVNKSFIRPKYLYFLLKHYRDVRRQISGVTTQAAGRLLVNTQTMQKLTFDVPPVDIQDLIISQAEQIEMTHQALELRESSILSLFREMREMQLGKMV